MSLYLCRISARAKYCQCRIRPGKRRKRVLHILYCAWRMPFYVVRLSIQTRDDRSQSPWQTSRLSPLAFFLTFRLGMYSPHVLPRPTDGLLKLSEDVRPFIYQTLDIAAWKDIRPSSFYLPTEATLE